MNFLKEVSTDTKEMERALHHGGMYLMKYLEGLCRQGGVANDVGFECLSFLNNIALKYKQHVQNSIQELRVWKKKNKHTSQKIVNRSTGEEKRLKAAIANNVEMYQIVMRESMMLSRQVLARQK